MAVIFVLALGVRIALAWLTYGPNHVYDGEAERIAKTLATKGAFADPYAIPTGPTAHCGPFYPALLSILYMIFGTGAAGTLARVGLLILVNSISCAVLPAAAMALGLPLWCGVGAGLASALIPIHRTAETFNAWDEPYAALGLMAVLILFVRWNALRERRLGALVTYGALWGLLLYLAAPLASVLAGLCLLGIFMSRGERSVWSEMRSWVVIAIAVGLVLLPWTIRNRMELGGWVFARSSFGLMFQISNTEEAGLLGDSRLHPSYSVPEAERVRSMGEIAYNHELQQTAVHWIQTHRKEFAVLTLERFVTFWSGWWGNPETAVFYSLTTLLAAFGAWFMWKDGHRQVLFVFLPAWICYPTVYYIVAYSPRYQIAIWWTVVLAAAYGAGCLIQRMRSGASEPMVVERGMDSPVASGFTGKTAR